MYYMKIALIILSTLLCFFHLWSIELSYDIWTKIITCSTSKTKETLGKCCTALHSLSSKNSLAIYLQSPLNLTQRQKEYALSYCAYRKHIFAVKNLRNHGAYTAYTH